MTGTDLWTTAMGRWCDDLADLMLPFERISLQRDDLLCMGAATPGFARAMDLPCPAQLSDTLGSDMATVMAQFPQGAHLRLDLCSLKSAAGNPRAVDTATALALLTQPNARVAGLIKRGLDCGEAQSLFAFPWRVIPPWAEFRMFVRGGRMVGVTQADAQAGAHAEIARHDVVLAAALAAFAEALLPRLPLRDVAVDVFADMQGDGCTIRLIELNPFVQRTDPGLFNWDFGGDFDGTFRYHRGTMPAVPAPQGMVTADQDIDIWRI